MKNHLNHELILWLSDDKSPSVLNIVNTSHTIAPPTKRAYGWCWIITINWEPSDETRKWISGALAFVVQQMFELLQAKRIKSFQCELFPFSVGVNCHSLLNTFLSHFFLTRTWIKSIYKCRHVPCAAFSSASFTNGCFIDGEKFGAHLLLNYDHLIYLAACERACGDEYYQSQIRKESWSLRVYCCTFVGLKLW